MNNIWITTLIAVSFVIVGYYLGQLWPPMGWIGFLAAIAIVGLYLFHRNKRIQ